MFGLRSPDFALYFQLSRFIFLPGIFEIVGQTFSHFRYFEGSYLTGLGVTKVVFLIFSKICTS